MKVVVMGELKKREQKRQYLPNCKYKMDLEFNNGSEQKDGT